jgi:hypothetical protein
MFLKWKTPIHSYMNLRHEQFEMNWIAIQFISNSINNWIKIQVQRNKMQIGGEDIEFLLMNMVLKK